ncbi:MAG: C-terminal binding protein [Candidatus Rokubacteria bacterium]|nr:C-terminal binding protein [Candidatus Rokubacteria bacterium]
MGFLVFHTDPLHSDFSAELEELASIGAELRIANCRTEEEVAEVCQNADALLVTYVKVGRKALEAMPRVRVVVRTGVGYDSLDLAAGTERKVMMANVPDYCITEVADHTMALLLAWWRRIGELDHQVRARGWGLPLQPVYRLEGKTLGILGLGRMGQAVAARARGFGLRLVGFDPYLPKEVFATLGIEAHNLEDLCRAADIVTLHSPLTPETRGIICERTLRLMKPTAVVVNTSRGGLVATGDLVRAIREGWIAGAALDVIEGEPLPMDHPIRSLPRVLLSPHTAWYSEEAESELRRRAARVVVQALRGERPVCLLNPEVLAAS